MVGIYIIRNKINNKVYIGQSVDVKSRLQHHKSSLRHNRHENDCLQKAWNKYGEDSFDFDVLEICEEADLDELERNYILYYNSMDRSHGYNFESGGSLHKHMSEEVRQKLSEKAKGRYAGEKNPMYGIHVPCSDEQKRRLSQLFSGKGNPMYGVHLQVSEESRRKISERMKGEKNPFYGKHHTEETKSKISKAHSGKKQSWEAVLKRGQTKCVRCLNNNMVFDSLSKAAEWAGNTAPESISRVCYHKQKTAGHNETTNEKYKWEFA